MKQVQEHEQIDLIERIQKLGVNLVTCGMCGEVQLIENDLEIVICYHCNFEGEQCDYPDLFFRGMSLERGV